MTRSKHFASIGTVILVSSLYALLTACSTDGNGGGSSATYGGATTAASITAENGEAFAESMMDGASGSDAAANLSAGQNNDKEQLIGAVRSIHSIVKNSDKQSVSGGLSNNATVYNFNQEVISECGGSLNYSFMFDDVTGEFSGSYIFDAYKDCNDNSRMNGGMAVSGTLDLNTFDISTMTATFNALTYVGDGESMTMSGEMVFTTLSATSYKSTMNMDFRDNAKNEVYRVENYIAVITEDALSTYADLDISGKFYHPTYGYVTLTTTTLLHIVYPDENPRSGVIEMTGAGGSKAVLTMTSNDTYTLQIDANGDATYETTKSCTWSTSTCI